MRDIIRDMRRKLLEPKAVITREDIAFLLNELDNQNVRIERYRTAAVELGYTNQALHMAIRVSNEGNENSDLRYTYNPVRGPEQLETLCNGVIVHIPVDWFYSIIKEVKKEQDI